MLESDDEIIGKAHHDDVTVRLLDGVFDRAG
jgi:hypothetical protein